jgi:hypothetical protein
LRCVIPQLDPKNRATGNVLVTNTIKRLFAACTQVNDALRPTSAMIIDQLKSCMDQSRGPASLIQVSAHSHLRSIPQDFWNHEMVCQLCRRMLRAGGAAYVDAFDKVREECNQRARPPIPRPAYPSIMTMSGLGLDQTRMVKDLRAGGESTVNAIICVRAMAAFSGSLDDLKGILPAIVSAIQAGKSINAAVAEAQLEESDEEEDDEDDDDEDDDNEVEEEEEEEDDDDDDDEDEDVTGPASNNHVAVHPNQTQRSQPSSLSVTAGGQSTQSRNNFVYRPGVPGPTRSVPQAQQAHRTAEGPRRPPPMLRNTSAGNQIPRPQGAQFMLGATSQPLMQSGPSTPALRPRIRGGLPGQSRVAR